MIDANKIRSTKYEDLWKGLKKQFDIEYPFYDNFGYSLPCDYHITSFIGMLNTRLNQDGQMSQVSSKTNDTFKNVLVFLD